MNSSTAVFLINKHLRAIRTTYYNDDENSSGRAGQSIRTFKSLDATLKVDDLVIVPTKTRHNMTVVKVIEVDVEVNFDDTTPMGWIIGKVDKDPYEKTLQEEQSALRIIQAAEFSKKRKELAEAIDLVKNEELKKLSIASPD